MLGCIIKFVDVEQVFGAYEVCDFRLLTADGGRLVFTAMERRFLVPGLNTVSDIIMKYL